MNNTNQHICSICNKVIPGQESHGGIGSAFGATEFFHNSCRKKSMTPTQQKQTHSSIPWKLKSYIAEDGTEVFEGVTDKYENRVLDFDYGIPSKEDADFFIRAVNSHEVLLEIAKQLLHYAEELLQGREMDEDIDALKKTIALAEGKEEGKCLAKAKK